MNYIVEMTYRVRVVAESPDEALEIAMGDDEGLYWTPQGYAVVGAYE